TMIKPELMPDVEPLMLECYRGDLILLSRFTPHRSEPNTSDRCRWSLDLRYQTTGHHTVCRVAASGAYRVQEGILVQQSLVPVQRKDTHR
ncbi:MAG: hypothetical protein OXU51_02465, partial [Candidatus Poribacteria bacterium]|nr:hypothetical protein [Candidatus Poribacteria bacterium]